MTDKKKDVKTELLAPAGDYECFLAAVSAGADAVYVGGNKFSARAYAANFDEDALINAIDHAHLYGKKLYLTVNTLLKNNEIKELYDYIAPLYEAGLDGVIVQDIGVISYLSSMFPGLPLHASTQMAVTGAEGVMLLKQLGITRVVPARELSLDEIRYIQEKTGMETECFIHGALCYSYSGKCLFSSIVGGRSGNRGRCAQPCRLPYDNRYLLSARDISTLKILPELIDAGIASFKIEGRMKSKEYVAGVTGIYRKYIDRYLNGGTGYSVDEDDMTELDDLYTRSGHCEGYYHKRNGKDMITLDKPSYNTADDSRLKLLYEKYAGFNRKISCRAVLRAYAGKPLLTEIECRGIRIEHKGAIVEKAQKQPTGEENLKKHFIKLGDTPFEPEEVIIDCGEDVFVPVSALNSLRREAFGRLKEILLNDYRRKSESASESVSEKDLNKDAAGKVLINIRIDRLSLLETVINAGLADIITVDINEFVSDNKDADQLDKELLRGVSKQIHSAGCVFYISLPSVIRRGYFDRYNELADILKTYDIEGVMADNYESLYYLKDSGYNGTLVTDVHMYCMNDCAVKALSELGADILTYPLELNRGELNKLDLSRGEFILYGRAPMMVSAQCIQKTADRCIKDNGVSHIKDRLGNSFPVVRNCNECYNTILNCVPTMIVSHDEIPAGISPCSYRIHFTTEGKEEAGRILDHYRAMLSGKAAGGEFNRTLLHLRRGVL